MINLTGQESFSVKLLLEEAFVHIFISDTGSSVIVVYYLINENNSIYLQAAFLLPVLTGMMKQGLTSSSFSPVQEPQALVVAPTRELAVQIFSDAKRFTHGTMLRPVVLYGGTSLGHQLRNVEQGSHIVVGTPGRLIDVINKGKVIQFVFNGLCNVQFRM